VLGWSKLFTFIFWSTKFKKKKTNKSFTTKPKSLSECLAGETKSGNNI